MVHRMLDCPGYPGDEDDIISSATGFWNTFAAYVTDLGDRMTHESLTFTHNHLTTAITSFWKKLRMPPGEIIGNWNSETRIAFGELRTEVKDFLDATYAVLHINLLDQIAEHILSALNRKDWTDVEVGLFTLDAIADSMNDSQEEDRILVRIFSTPLFDDISQKFFSFPTRLQRTAVDAIGSLSPFFERNTQCLPGALNYLFSSLNSVPLVHVASKSIYTLCSLCRKHLSQELDILFQQYSLFLSSSAADSLTKEKVLSAIAAVIQGLSSDDSKIAPLHKILGLVEADLKAASNVTADGRQDLATSAYQCLAGISKASQSQDDGPIVVDADRTDASVNIWTFGAGRSIQERTLHYLEIGLITFGSFGDVVEAVFATVRHGLTETAPGPFVFPTQGAIYLLEKTSLSTPRLDYVLATTSTLLNTHIRASSPELTLGAARILQHICNLINQLCQPSNDPEVAQGCVDVLTAVLSSQHAHIFLNLQPPSLVEEMLNFTLACLQGSDILPKRSAATFWV